MFTLLEDIENKGFMDLSVYVFVRKGAQICASGLRKVHLFVRNCIQICASGLKRLHKFVYSYSVSCTNLCTVSGGTGG